MFDRNSAVPSHDLEPRCVQSRHRSSLRLCTIFFAAVHNLPYLPGKCACFNLEEGDQLLPTRPASQKAPYIPDGRDWSLNGRLLKALTSTRSVFFVLPMQRLQLFELSIGRSCLAFGA